MRRLLPLLALLSAPFVPARALAPADWLVPLVRAAAPFSGKDQDEAARFFFRFADLAHECGDDALAAACVKTAAACYGADRDACPGRYLDALRAYPDSVALRNQAAWALLVSARGQAPAALALLAPVPPGEHTPETLDTLALAQLRAGRKVAALQTCLRLIDRADPRDFTFLVYLDRFGDVLYANGRPRAALRAWLAADACLRELLRRGVEPAHLFLLLPDPARPRLKARALRTRLAPGSRGQGVGDAPGTAARPRAGNQISLYT